MLRGNWILIVVLCMTTKGLQAADTLAVKTPEDVSHTQTSEKGGWLKRTLESFSDQDTLYVEPQHYNWALMLQSVNTYDYYHLSSTKDGGQSFSFSPSVGLRLGPYFGWRWIFLGYTFDLRNFNLFSGKRKLEIDGSIYSARFCADVYYRRSVDDYKIRSADLGPDVNTSPLEDCDFDGLNVSITGLNLYYIFNHRRFSYPAAFAQSTCQKISCGSWMAGMGYTHNTIDFDYKRMEAIVRERLGQSVTLDSAMMFNNVQYSDISASVGYAYNWVFARNWLFCASLCGTLAYKQSRGVTEQTAPHAGTENADETGFSFKNFNIDGVWRLGLVWNNTRWYTGASAILRSYNYRKSQFAANNIFGDLCIYFGLNFGPRKAYKK